MINFCNMRAHIPVTRAQILVPSVELRLRTGPAKILHPVHLKYCVPMGRCTSCNKGAANKSKTAKKMRACA